MYELQDIQNYTPVRLSRATSDTTGVLVYDYLATGFVVNIELREICLNYMFYLVTSPKLKFLYI